EGYRTEGDSAERGGWDVAADKIESASERARLLDQQPSGGHRYENGHHPRNMSPRSAADCALEPRSDGPARRPASIKQAEALDGCRCAKCQDKAWQIALGDQHAVDEADCGTCADTERDGKNNAFVAPVHHRGANVR